MRTHLLVDVVEEVAHDSKIFFSWLGSIYKMALKYMSLFLYLSYSCFVLSCIQIYLEIALTLQL